MTYIKNINCWQFDHLPNNAKNSLINSYSIANASDDWWVDCYYSLHEAANTMNWHDLKIYFELNPDEATTEGIIYLEDAIKWINKHHTTNDKHLDESCYLNMHNKISDYKSRMIELRMESYIGKIILEESSVWVTNAQYEDFEIHGDYIGEVERIEELLEEWADFLLDFTHDFNSSVMTMLRDELERISSEEYCINHLVDGGEWYNIDGDEITEDPVDAQTVINSFHEILNWTHLVSSTLVNLTSNDKTKVAGMLKGFAPGIESFPVEWSTNIGNPSDYADFEEEILGDLYSGMTLLDSATERVLRRASHPTLF